MEDDDCYSFGSYDEIFSHPAAACSEHPHGTEDAGESTPGSADVSSQSAILVGTHLLDNGFFVPEDDVTSNESLFHGRHIGLKIKQNGKLLTFNFPPPSTTAESTSIRVCMDSNSRTHALGDLYLNGNELVWRPMRHSDTMQTSSGQVYGSDRFSLRIGLEHIHDVLPTKVQNVMLALSISMAVLDITFEFSFMPGPYYKTSKRDDLWNLLKEALLALKAAPPLAAVSTVAHAVNHPDVALLDAPLQHPQPISPTTEAGSRGFTTSPATTTGPTIPLPSPRRTKSVGVDTTQRNTLIRTYLSMDATSDQAIALAVHIHQVYKYPIGPTSKTSPSFLDDKVYRQAQVSTLTHIMTRMKRAWKLNDDRLDDLMRVRCSKNEDDDLVYHDTASNELLPVKAYERRYRQHIMASPSSTILLRRPTATTLRQSVILDASFRPARQFELPPVPAALTGEARLEAEREREARMVEMQQSQADLWNEFARLTQLHFAQVDLIRAAYGQSMDVLTSAAKTAKTKPSKQPASSRRRSMVPAPLDELKENHDANNKKKRKRVSTTTSIPGTDLPPDF
ncbi:hypothetical protein DYB37_006241 [Aphanomyces astaci]|uniref:Uncharacterized protein n=1 Tax=Aphanomyces astaci TaxID=112090 RepID=A0A3R6YBI2_APHAT|nr:hypothetical protein DYB37_006241 [Aphanomyces astaci]